LLAEYTLPNLGRNEDIVSLCLGLGHHKVRQEIWMLDVDGGEIIDSRHSLPMFEDLELFFPTQFNNTIPPGQSQCHLDPQTTLFSTGPMRSTSLPSAPYSTMLRNTSLAPASGYRLPAIGSPRTNIAPSP
jgi:hypothetical protein